MYFQSTSEILNAEEIKSYAKFRILDVTKFPYTQYVNTGRTE